MVFNPRTGEGLNHNDLLLVLYEHDRQRSWHWAFYLHHEPPNLPNFPGQAPPTGYKIHVTTKHGGWKYECVPQNLEISSTYVTATKIGALPPDWNQEYVDAYTKSVPVWSPANPIPGFTCKTWIIEAIKALEDTHLFFRCNDVDLLIQVYPTNGVES